jgi:hypothetical protein
VTWLFYYALGDGDDGDVDGGDGVVVMVSRLNNRGVCGRQRRVEQDSKSSGAKFSVE